MTPNPFIEIVTEIQNKMLLELRGTLADLNPHANTDTHAITNSNQIYMGGVDPIIGTHPSWEETRKWEQRNLGHPEAESEQQFVNFGSDPENEQRY